MSRTKHHIRQKQNKWGFDYWSRRPGNKGGGGFGAFAKDRTHSMERAEEARLISREVRLYDKEEDA